jgi:hypothetical protein
MYKMTTKIEEKKSFVPSHVMMTVSAIFIVRLFLISKLKVENNKFLI